MVLEVAAGSARGGPQPACEHPGSPPRSTQQQGLESLENGGARGWSGTCRTAYFSKVCSLCTIVPGRPKTVWAPNQAFTPDGDGNWLFTPYQPLPPVPMGRMDFRVLDSCNSRRFLTHHEGSRRHGAQSLVLVGRSRSW
jgi:hypothetical protein